MMKMLTAMDTVAPKGWKGGRRKLTIMAGPASVIPRH